MISHAQSNNEFLITLKLSTFYDIPPSPPPPCTHTHTHTHTYRVNHQLQEATDKVATLEKQLQRYNVTRTRLVQCMSNCSRKELVYQQLHCQFYRRVSKWSLTSLHALSSPSPCSATSTAEEAVEERMGKMRQEMSKRLVETQKKLSMQEAQQAK